MDLLVIIDSSSRRGIHSFEARDVLINLRLQLPDLLQRPFRQHGKVSWILRQNLVAIRFENALHPAHLVDGLVELFWRLNHSLILSMPFFRAGRCRTWAKNSLACTRFSVPFFTTPISNPKRRRTRCCASALRRRLEEPSI